MQFEFTETKKNHLGGHPLTNKHDEMIEKIIAAFLLYRPYIVLRYWHQEG